MVKILGIDEAGRGPVMGPLVIAGVMINKENTIKLDGIGTKDSKLLSQKQRELIASTLNKKTRNKIIKIEPWEIDEAIDGPNDLNLNWLEARKAADIINHFEDVDEVYIDCPSPNIEAYTNYIKKLLNREVKLIVEHKADSKYLVVGAASILAKVIREEEVEKIEIEVGESIGSGYPSNPVCQEFLKKNWEKYPNIFRKSWASWKNHVVSKEQSKLGQFDTK